MKQILSFSRATEQEKRPVKVSRVVDEALKFLRASIPATIEIKSRHVTGSDMIFADRTEVHQVLLNLCTNAAQAMQENGGTLEVTLSEATVSASDYGFLRSREAGSLREADGKRHGVGHGAPCDGPHLRPLLYHEEARRRHRPRPFRGPRDREAP